MAKTRLRVPSSVFIKWHDEQNRLEPVFVIESEHAVPFKQVLDMFISPGSTACNVELPLQPYIKTSIGGLSYGGYFYYFYITLSNFSCKFSQL